MKVTKKVIKKLIREALEDRLNPELHDPESMEQGGWTAVPPEELHGALSAAIYDLYKYVNGIRPRWIRFDEMSVEELEDMHHGLTAELEQQAQEDEAHSYKPDYDPSEYARGLEDRHIADHDAYEAEKELMMTPEEGEDEPQRQGMGRRPLVGPARDVRRGRKISERLNNHRLREMIKEEYNKALVENVTNIKFTPEEEETICAALHGYDDSFYGSSAYEKLFDYFMDIPEEKGGIPYGIAKARTGDPDLWILDKLDPSMFGACEHIDSAHFLQEKFERPLKKEVYNKIVSMKGLLPPVDLFSAAYKKASKEIPRPQNLSEVEELPEKIASLMLSWLD